MMQDFKSQEELDWEQQLRDVEETEKWDKSVDLIPQDLQNDFRSIFQTLPSKNKIQVLKMLGSMSWMGIYCSNVRKILHNTPADLRSSMVEIIFSYLSPKQLLDHVITLFSQLEALLCVELIVNLSRDDVKNLTDVTQFFDHDDLFTFVLLVHQLSIRDMLEMFKNCKDPMSKHCKLCKSRRLRKLETRLLNGQVPPGVVPIAAMVPLYDTAEVWTCDDEQLFKFDLERFKIFWNRELVDLVKICDKCVFDVNRAASSESR